MSSAEKGRIKSLDGLRGIAILLILFYHLCNVGFLSQMFTWGWCGVDLFFVLSGFLITGILLDTKGSKGYFKNFFIKRALRIFPLYYSVLIVFAFVAPLSDATAWFAKHQFWYWTNMSNILMLREGFFKPLGHFWSLATEEQFYLLWPIIVFYLKPGRLVILSILLLIVAIICRWIFTDQVIVYALPLARFDGILIGSIIAVFMRTHQVSLYKFINIIFIGCSSLLFAYLLLMNLYQQDGLLHLPFSITLVCLFFGSFLIMALRWQSIGNLLSNRVLLFFGKYSYAMYIFNSIIKQYLNWAGVDRMTGNMKLLFYAGAFILTIIVSYASYHLVEARFLALKKNLKSSQRGPFPAG